MAVSAGTKFRIVKDYVGSYIRGDIVTKRELGAHFEGFLSDGVIEPLNAPKPAVVQSAPTAGETVASKEPAKAAAPKKQVAPKSEPKAQPVVEEAPKEEADQTGS